MIYEMVVPYWTHAGGQRRAYWMLKWLVMGWLGLKRKLPIKGLANEISTYCWMSG